MRRISFLLRPVSHYRIKVKNNAKTTMPIINRHQKALMTVDAIFTGLRLSSLLTQIPERIKPATTLATLTPAQTVFTPSGNLILRNTGTSVATGRILTISAAILKVFRFLFDSSRTNCMLEKYLLIEPHFGDREY